MTKPTTILGINGGFRAGYQDVSACLVRNGEVIAAVEEERLNRIKFSPGRLPFLAVKEVLAIAGITIQEVDYVAFHGSTWEAEIETRIADYFSNNFGYAPPIKRYHHHDCHSAGAYYSSGFSKALVVSMDNSGDGVSIQVSIGEGGNLTLLKRYNRPISFGVFYSLFTQYCGFTKDSDEYKLMGLAAYGDPNRFDFSWLMCMDGDELVLNTDYIVTVPPRAPSLHRDEMNFTPAFVERMGASRRLPGTEISQFYKDVAASAQRHMEGMMLQLLQHYLPVASTRKLCLSGGVALNCLMNGTVMQSGLVDEIFIQPASTDAGISQGAAWLTGLDLGITPIAPNNMSLGNSFTDEQVLAVLQTCKAKFYPCNDPAAIAAELLSQNKVIGWFQGRMEFGPRALGNRSILANPSAPNVQQEVNRRIKFRDSFRPFGASVLEQDTLTYFDGISPQAPYMTIVYKTREAYKAQLAGVTHADGTCRIQSVNETQNPLYHHLLSLLKEKTGMGVCLNTSYNLNYEPIVCTPQQALATFYASGLDHLVIGHYLVVK